MKKLLLTLTMLCGICGIHAQDIDNPTQIVNTQSIDTPKASKTAKKSVNDDFKKDGRWNSPHRANRYPLGLSLGYTQKRWRTDNGSLASKRGWWRDENVKGVQVGLRVNPQFDYGFALNSGVYYEYYYTSDPMQFIDDGNGKREQRKGTFEEQVLSFPLNLEYRIHFTHGLNIFASAGLAADYGIVCRVKYKDMSGQVAPIVINDAYDEYDNIKPFNMSCEFSIGAQYECFQVRATFNRGLTNQSDTPGVKVMRDKPLILSFSLMM